MKTRKRAATRTGKYCSSARVFGVSMPEEESASEVLAKKIAGDIVLAKTPSAAIQKWRNIFKISQRALAEEMGIMSSVISDYESGRRSSPGVGMIKKIVSALISIDQKTGSVVCNEFNSMYTDEKLNDVIIDIRELDPPTDIKSIKAAVDGVLVSDKKDLMKSIYGYTIIDPIKAIVDLSPKELVKLYGLTTERAMVFTNIAHGRSPLIAIKVTNLRPGVVVFHGLEKIDPLAERIALVEKIPVIVSKLKSVDELVHNLKML